MYKFLISSLPTILIVLSYALIFFIIVIWRLKARKKINPVTVKLKRTSGESLRNKLDELNLDITECLTLSALMPLLILSLHLSESYLAEMPETVSRFFFNFIGMLIATIYFLRKLFKKLHERENYRLGFDAERAVGQELNNLIIMGYKIFHDIPGDKFNIDHVVVGPAGIFCIETKGRPKSKSDGGESEYEVFYDGDKFKFPHWTETKVIEQVKRNANWLSRELNNVLKTQITVIPVICIAGWYINKKEKYITPIAYNGKHPELIFPKIKGYELSQDVIYKIVNQIELWINDVEPMSYKKNS